MASFPWYQVTRSCLSLKERQNRESQPRRGYVIGCQAVFKNRHNPVHEFDFFSSQSWLKNANPGLQDEIPSGFIPRLNSARCPLLIPNGAAETCNF